jgi:hypothetical protein
VREVKEKHRYAPDEAPERGLVMATVRWAAERVVATSGRATEKLWAYDTWSEEWRFLGRKNVGAVLSETVSTLFPNGVTSAA